MTEMIVLLFIGIILIVLNVNAIKKDKKSFSGTLKDKENNMQDYEIEIGKIRRDLSETVLELQQEIEALKLTRETNNINKQEHESRNIIEQVSENNVVQQNENESKEEAKLQHEDIYEIKNEAKQKSKNQSEEKEKKKNYIKKADNDLNNYGVMDENNKSNDNNVKVTEIKAMLDKGLTVDEISEKIGIGKGEVLLIKELYIK